MIKRKIERKYCIGAIEQIGRVNDKRKVELFFSFFLNKKGKLNTSTNISDISKCVTKVYNR